jgi:hypothetical protein
MSRFFHTLLLASAACFTVHALAQEHAQVQVSLADYGPAFVKRMEQAVDDQAKWAAWSSQTDAAAFLSQQLGQEALQAKVLAAWPRYKEVQAQLEKGFNGLAPSPVEAMNKINANLGLNKEIKLNFVAYAGLFDGKVASSSKEGVASLYIPIEQGGAQVSPAIAREYARIAVQRMLPSLEGRNVAEVAVHEGLMLHLAKTALPGSSEDSFVDAAWLTKAQGNQSALMAGIKPQLAASSAEALAKFTTGTGTTGLNNEAVYAGKLVVERWLRQGLSIREILATPKADMARSVGRVLDAIAKR